MSGLVDIRFATGAAALILQDGSEELAVDKRPVYVLSVPPSQQAQHPLKTLMDGYHAHRKQTSIDSRKKARPAERKKNPKVSKSPRGLNFQRKFVSKTEEIRINGNKSSGAISRPVAKEQNIPMMKFDTRRTQVLLPRLDKVLVQKAKFLTSKISRERKVNQESYETAYRRLLAENVGGSVIQAADASNKELYYLTTYLCFRSKKRPKAPNQALPRNFMSTADPDLLVKQRIFLRYMLSEENNIKTAAEVEAIKNWKAIIKDAGCASVLANVSMPDALKIAYPGYLSGDYPVIRPHKLNFLYRTKHEFSKEAVAKRIRTAILAMDIYTADGKISKRKFLKIPWSETLRHYHEQSVRLFGGALNLLDAALPEIFGIESNQIQPWDLPGLVHWKEGPSNDYKYLKMLTRYIVEKKLKRVDETGAVDAMKIKAINNWDDQFEKVADGAIMNSPGVSSIYNVFEITYPELMGWRYNEINPGDISYQKMWHGANGKLVFKQRMAKALYEFCEALKHAKVRGFMRHGVQFDPDSDPPLIISSNEMQKIRQYLLANHTGWNELFGILGLRGPCEVICKHNISKSLELLFGKLDKTTGEFGSSGIHLSDVFENSQRKNSLDRLAHEELEGMTSAKLEGLMLYPERRSRVPGPEIALKEELSSLVRPGKASPLRIAKLCLKAKRTRAIDIQSGNEALAHVVAAKQNDEYVLSAKHLGQLLLLIKDHLLSKMDLSVDQYNATREMIDEIFTAHRTTKRSYRDSLTSLIKDRALLANPVGVLNQAVQSIIGYSSYLFS